jgi:dTDP-4-amino-4,6-dideoxygalactose transaminase
MIMPRSTDEKLAIEGGAPVRQKSFAGWPQFDDEQIEAATAVLRSGRVNYWTGEAGRLFEAEFARAIGTRHAIAVANGTVALELALYALGIGPGDEVIVPSRTFVATASAVAIRGATPVFADVDRDSQNLTAETIEPRITPHTRAVILVHLAGWPCEMDRIAAVARRRGLKVIEDCAQAHGAAWRGQPVGSFGDVAAFSFCQDKILTTAGEGGMVVTQDAQLSERAWSYKDHGKCLHKMAIPAASPAFRPVHDSLGTNWRMTEVQSAIGRVALLRLKEWVAARRRLAARLNGALAAQPALRITEPASEAFHSYYKYYVFLRPDCLRPDWSRDSILQALQAEGIPCGSGICPEVYEEGAFRYAAQRPAQRFAVARELGETSLMFPVHPTLCASDMDDVVRALTKVLARATRNQRLADRAAA